MAEASIGATLIPMDSGAGIRDALTDMLREGARTMLQAAIEAEVADYVNLHATALDSDGRRLVVRNGHHPTRAIQTGIGNIPITKPKVNDRRLSIGETNALFPLGSTRYGSGSSLQNASDY